MKKTLILGASTNPARYAFAAAHRLKGSGHPVVLLGLREGEVAGEAIGTTKVPHDDIDTVTLYVGPRHQPEYYEYILSLKPRRVIFNPGTENREFERMLSEAGVEPLHACTLVMLSMGTY
jgi:uncharacterized protein